MFMQEEEHEYRYQLKPLIVPGTAYLIGYPIIIVFLVLILKLSLLERYILFSLYVVTSIGILGLWIYGRSKGLRIEEDSIFLYSLSGKRHLAPEDIRKVVLYTLPKGAEIVQIKTCRNQVYYISELYFPFPELMSDLEQFIGKHRIQSNID